MKNCQHLANFWMLRNKASPEEFIKIMRFCSDSDIFARISFYLCRISLKLSASWQIFEPSNLNSPSISKPGECRNISEFRCRKITCKEFYHFSLLFNLTTVASFGNNRPISKCELHPAQLTQNHHQEYRSASRANSLLRQNSLRARLRRMR
jgi:hypothetical protein